MPKSASSVAAHDLPRTLGQAVALHREGRLADAEKLYVRILKLAPSQFDAMHLLGALKLQAGKVGEAYRLLDASLRINPRSADALTNYGLVLRALKREPEALESFDRALALDPSHFEAQNNRGLLLLGLGRPEEALAAFDEAVRRNPRGAALVNRGTALAALGRLEEAVAHYDRALATSPADPGAWFNRGTALHALGRFEEAVESFDRALAVKSVYPAAWNNRAIALYALNRHPEALASCERAISVDKNYGDAQHNRALALLVTGDFTPGFRQYEWRNRRTGLALRRDLSRPLWLGEYPLARKSILLHAEQGLGDTIFFARYAPLLARAGATVIIEAQPELGDLLTTLDGAPTVIVRGAQIPAHDVQCPLPSLPLAFRTAIDSIPAEIPYLRANPERMAAWRARIAMLRRPLIALAWAGNAAHANDRNRSIELAQLLPLFDMPGSWVSLQRDLREGDAAQLAQHGSVLHLGGELESFADTAAVVALADLVISVDTAVAHLAGAMGRPVFMLLPFAPDWRWLTEREDSPWYPTARLFRQPALGDWASVVARVRHELSHLSFPEREGSCGPQ